MLDQHIGDPSRFLCRGSARGGDPSSGIWRPGVEECKAHRDECVLGQLGRFIEHDLEASSTSGGDFCPPVGRTHRVISPPISGNSSGTVVQFGGI